MEKEEEKNDNEKKEQKQFELNEKFNLRDLPAYGQYSNGCGLASLLMLLNPPKNPEIEVFLNKTWEILTPLLEEFAEKEIEYKWALVLQYILLKVQGNSEDSDKNELHEIFRTRMEYNYDDQCYINLFTQQQKRTALLDKDQEKEAYLCLHYEEGEDLLTPFQILENLSDMKTDMELKILANIFNFEFDYQKFSHDITGAVVFLPKELKGKHIKENTKKKWRILEKKMENEDTIMFYGRVHHWMPIRGFYLKLKNHWNARSMFFNINDPLTKRSVDFNIKDITSHDRFLIFKKRNNGEKNAGKMRSLIERILKEDVEKELTIWKRYQEELEQEQN